MKARIVRNKREHTLRIDCLGLLMVYLIRHNCVKTPRCLTDLKEEVEVDAFDIGKKIWRNRKKTDEREELSIKTVEGVTLHLVPHKTTKQDPTFWHVWVTGPSTLRKAIEDLQGELEAMPEFEVLQEAPK